jgi:hypothetical protein
LIGKTLRFRGKLLRRRIKSRRLPTYFTLCLPGSPKVNAGGACGAWLPGRELSRVSAFRDRIEGTGGLFCLTQPGKPRRHCARTRNALRATFDELVQWMVQDAPLDR